MRGWGLGMRLVNQLLAKLHSGWDQNGCNRNYWFDTPYQAKDIVTISVEDAEQPKATVATLTMTFSLM